MRKQRKHERSLRATHGGDEAQVSVMSSRFPKRLFKEIVAQFPKAKMTLFLSNRGPLFWISPCVKKQLWDTVSRVQDSLYMIYARWCPSSDSPITYALRRTLARVPTWADGASGLFAHTLGCADSSWMVGTNGCWSSRLW